MQSASCERLRFAWWASWIAARQLSGTSCQLRGAALAIISGLHGSNLVQADSISPKRCSTRSAAAAASLASTPTSCTCHLRGHGTEAVGAQRRDRGGDRFRHRMLPFVACATGAGAGALGGWFAAVGGGTSTSTGEGAWTRSAAPRSSWSSCASACPRSTCNRESRREVDDSSPSETSPEGAAALETAAVDPAAASTEGTGGASAARGSCPLTTSRARPGRQVMLAPPRRATTTTAG